MADGELTLEQKNYVLSLANVTPKYSVGQLRQIKNAFIKGMSIQEVEGMFSPDIEEKGMEQMIEQFLEGKNMTSTTQKVAANSCSIEKESKTEIMGAISEEETKVYTEIPMAGEETPNRNARAEPGVKETEIEKISEKVQENRVEAEEVSETAEDMEAVLAMAKDAINQLNEVKVKYELMDEFIHRHVLEEKDKEIAMLKEENRKLKEDLQQSAIRAAPISVSPIPVNRRTEIMLPMPEKKTHRRGIFWKLLKKDISQNYIVKLFSNPKFTAEQIAEIRLGLESDLNESQIKSYARQEISARQMKEIRMLYELQNRKQQQQEGGNEDGSTG